jgi:hypothetical protein
VGLDYKPTIFVQNITVQWLYDDGEDKEWKKTCTHYKLQGCILKRALISACQWEFHEDCVTTFRIIDHWGQANDEKGELITRIRKDWMTTGIIVKVLRIPPEYTATDDVGFIEANGRFIGYFLRNQDALALEALMAEFDLSGTIPEDAGRFAEFQHPWRVFEDYEYL